MGLLVGKLLLVTALLCSVPLWAQQENQPSDSRKSNAHLGWPISVPLNPMANFTHVGTGVSYGVGYNFSRRHAVIGEFLWDWLNPRVSNVAGTGNLKGSNNLYVLSGNYRFELRGKALGTYLIAGCGWYLRDSSQSNTYSSAFGVNGGAGFTVRVADAPWRMYFESRYHYAPTKNVDTQLIVTTIGIRY
jgi:hypothetical protein